MDVRSQKCISSAKRKCLCVSVLFCLFCWIHVTFKTIIQLPNIFSRGSCIIVHLNQLFHIHHPFQQRYIIWNIPLDASCWSCSVNKRWYAAVWVRARCCYTLSIFKRNKFSCFCTLHEKLLLLFTSIILFVRLN